MTSLHEEAASQRTITMLDSSRSTAMPASESVQVCVEAKERRIGLSETSPDPGTVTERPARLTFSHSPLHSLLDFLLSSPLRPGVISLMMCNAVKVFHQPDLLKWSMGNALGHCSSHPRSLSLSLCLCPSLSLIYPVKKSFLLSIVCPEPRSFLSAFLSCLTQLSPPSLSLSLHFWSCLSPAPPFCGVWTRPLNQQHDANGQEGFGPYLWALNQLIN